MYVGFYVHVLCHRLGLKTRKKCHCEGFQCNVNLEGTPVETFLSLNRSLRGLPFMVSALKGEGVPSKADIVSNLSKEGCMNLRTWGKGVNKSQNSYIHIRHIWKPPNAHGIFLVNFLVPHSH